MAAPVVERILVIESARRVLDPKDWLERHASGWPEELLRKVLHDNAARLYSLE